MSTSILHLFFFTCFLLLKMHYLDHILECPIGSAVTTAFWLDQYGGRFASIFQRCPPSMFWGQWAIQSICDLTVLVFFPFPMNDSWWRCVQKNTSDSRYQLHNKQTWKMWKWTSQVFESNLSREHSSILSVTTDAFRHFLLPKVRYLSAACSRCCYIYVWKLPR